MSNLTPANMTRGLLGSGAVNAPTDAGTDRDLALSIFSGQVLEAFYQKTRFFDNTGNFMVSKMLDGGHEARWPVIGEHFTLSDIGNWTDSGSDGDYDSVTTEGGLKAGYHVPGEFIEGKRIKMSEQKVRVDDVLVAAIDVPFIDLDLAHFEMLAPFARKLGRSLAVDNDRKIAAVAWKAARQADEPGIYSGGQEVIRSGASHATTAGAYPDSSVGSSRFRDDVAQLAEKFDNVHCPEDGRTLFISPYIRRILRHEGTQWAAGGTTTAVTYGPAGNPYSKDTSSQPWDVATRYVGMLEGFNLVVTNNLPGQWADSTKKRFAVVDSNFSKYDFMCVGNASVGSTNEGLSDNADTRRPAAIALCGAQEGSAAIGMVQAGGIRSIAEDDERRNTRFLKSQMLVGYDILSPWCAGAISTHDS